MKSSNKSKGWYDDEDKIIAELVAQYGLKAWAKIAEQLHVVYNYPKKTGKQCRQRWHNHLDPNIVKKSWTRAEQDVLFQEHRKHGNKWTQISANLPGRTDNSIKNHFYSTVRKSLRRVSKFLGSKNSTSKMRSIKPSTLSKIFSLADEKPEEEGDGKNQMKNCKQIVDYLMNFARCKLSDRRYVMDQQEKNNFLHILDQMVAINNLYENEKIVEAKIKKERLLERNFDQAASSGSQQESLDISQNSLLKHHQIAETMEKINGYELVTTRSQRKIKPPIQFEGECKKKGRKQSVNEVEKQKMQQVQLHGDPEIKEQQNDHIMMKRLLSPVLQDEQQYDEAPMGQSRKNQASELNNIDEFFIELQNGEFQSEYYNSPNIIHTPNPISPQAMYGEVGKQFYPIKAEECDLVRNQIMEKIQKNSNLSIDNLPRLVFMPSPSSAFKQYC